MKINDSKVTERSAMKSVLVIDDSLDSLYLGKFILEADGFSVFTASSGAEALSVLAEIEEPNLVLLDMNMEDMTGSAFLEVLEKKMPNFISNVPVVFYSAADDMPAGKAAGVIRKDGDIEQFLKQVHAYTRTH